MGIPIKKRIVQPIQVTSNTFKKVANNCSNLTSSPLSDLPPSSDSVGAAGGSGQVAHPEAERIPTSGLSRYKSSQHDKINKSLRDQGTIEGGVKTDIQGIDQAIADYMQSHHAPIAQMLYRGTSCLEFGYRTEDDLWDKGIYQEEGKKPSREKWNIAGVYLYLSIPCLSKEVCKKGSIAD